MININSSESGNQKVLMYLERLRRNYEASVRTYDQISFWELSHSLRIWADLKGELTNIAPAFATTLAFKSSIPCKKARRATRGNLFVYAYMPGGVVTYASDGELVSGNNIDGTKERGTVSVSCKLNPNGSIELKNFYYVSSVLEETERKVLVVEETTRCNYVQWMGAEAVRLSYPTDSSELSAIAIPREAIIRRVANTLDGSHPSVGNVSEDNENRYDAAISKLLQYKMAGIPLPYFILLKIAQDILTVAPKLLRVEEKKSSS